MHKRQILQQIIQTITQRAGRNKAYHMMQTQEPQPPHYPEDGGPLTDNQLEQIKNSARTKYA
jgi:hypothetical protein